MKSLILTLIISTQALFANTGSGGFDMMQLVPIALLFVIFYFLLLRPQQKKAKAHQDMIKVLRPGDHVVTAGGILGTVDRVTEKEVIVEVANNVKIRVVKATITEVLSKNRSTAEAAKAPVKSAPANKSAVSPKSAPVKKAAPKKKASPAMKKAVVKKAKPSKAKPAMKKIAKPATKPVNNKKKKSKK